MYSRYRIFYLPDVILKPRVMFKKRNEYNYIILQTRHFLKDTSRDLPVNFAELTKDVSIKQSKSRNVRDFSDLLSRA